MKGAYSGWSEIANSITVTKTRRANSKQITEWNSELICSRAHATRVISHVAVSNVLADVMVSSQFDRRLFRSRVHSIETKGQFGRSKGFDRRVNDKN